jgi:hypothetical protein
MMKRVFPALYCIWIGTFVFYALISCHSYYSVLGTFGRVPGNDELYELARQTEQRIKTFPVEEGKVLILFWVCSVYLIPFLLRVNYIVFRLNRKIRFEWKLAILLSALWIAMLLLMNFEWLGWYFQYVLD